MAVENIAPTPQFPEKVGATYERKMAGAMPGQRGPLRFEEGVALTQTSQMIFSWD